MTKMPRRRHRIVTSLGESRCGEYLRSQGYQVVPQYSISALPKYRFDYYFSHGNRHYLLEFDGRQHFKMTPWFHRNERAFRRGQERDLLKTAAAIASGYYVIRIAHQHLPRLDDIIASAVQGEERLIVSSAEIYAWLISQEIPINKLEKLGINIPV
jgi:hypothetical protein